MIGLEEVKKKRIAFVHDWLTGMRGGETVLERMIDVLGPRDIYTLVSIPENLSPLINSCRIHTSFIQNLPFGQRKHQIWLPFFPLAVESFDLNEYDIVVSISTCVARGAITNPYTFHFGYVNTPVRYAWEFSRIYQESMKPKWLMRFVWPLLMHYLRNWDANCRDRVDAYCGNSRHVCRRICKYYGKDAQPMYPSVNVNRFNPIENPTRDFYLVFGALVPYKRVDLAIEACKRLKKRLIIGGGGQELSSLQKLSQGYSNIEFLGKVENEKAVELFQNAKCLIFPGEEDFGITPLEAQACHTPVIAYGAGGALETIDENHTGLFFREQTVDSLCRAIEQFETMSFSHSKMRKKAQSFSDQVLRDHFSNHLVKTYNEFLKNL